jgi:uncharacterized cupredoxin-like copper-binding protein
MYNVEDELWEDQLREEIRKKKGEVQTLTPQQQAELTQQATVRHNVNELKTKYNRAIETLRVLCRNAPTAMHAFIHAVSLETGSSTSLVLRFCSFVFKNETKFWFGL